MLLLLQRANLVFQKLQTSLTQNWQWTHFWSQKKTGDVPVWYKRYLHCCVYDDILTSWSNRDGKILFVSAIRTGCMAPPEVLLLRNPHYTHSVTTSFVYIQSIIQRRSTFNSLFCNKRVDWKHCLNIFSSVQLTHFDTWPQDTVQNTKILKWTSGL